uniref:Uncharacterized protein n=1 Tax=Medicago truncatula TaxID=3880 RepID=Q2HSH8_MEDTR|nr:hypothetical protein MtrDRAFT_AC151522g31v2 [Medicago truncatula]
MTLNPHLLLGGTMEKRYEQTLSAGMDGNCEYTCHALIWHQSMYFGIACYTVKAGLKTDRDISSKSSNKWELLSLIHS